MARAVAGKQIVVFAHWGDRKFVSKMPLTVVPDTFPTEAAWLAPLPESATTEQIVAALRAEANRLEAHL